MAVLAHTTAWSLWEPSIETYQGHSHSPRQLSHSLSLAREIAVTNFRESWSFVIRVAATIPISSSPARHTGQFGTDALRTMISAQPDCRLLHGIGNGPNGHCAYWKTNNSCRACA
jgi:hypothetical protein